MWRSLCRTVWGFRSLVQICCRLIVELIGTISCASVFAYDQNTRHITDTCTRDTNTCYNCINRVCLVSWYGAADYCLRTTWMQVSHVINVIVLVIVLAVQESLHMCLNDNKHDILHVDFNCLRVVSLLASRMVVSL